MILVFLSFLGSRLLSEAYFVEVRLVDIQADFSRGVLDCLFGVPFLVLQFLLCCNNSEFLFLDPFGVHFSLFDGNFALRSVGNINSLWFVILCKGGLFWWRKHYLEQLSHWLIRNRLFSRFFRFIFVALFDVLLLVLLILHVSDVSVASPCFSGAFSELQMNYSLPVPDLRSR